MNAYTSTWQHKVKWSISSKRTSRAYETRLSTTDKRFIWVEKGTKKRFRKMSPGFMSKSTPHSLKARSGSGQAAGFSKRPLKGITARENLETLAKVRRKIFVAKTAARFNAAAKELFSQ